jgi:leader peptidase (prepilin peptidase)/N-methyltransferase
MSPNKGFFMTIIFFVFGLIIGSFLNVCICRIPLHKSIINPPSSCGSCGHRLKYYDMLPVINYVINGGKCRYCGEKYSIQYPLIELFNGLLYGAIVLKYSISTIAVLYCILGSILIIVSAIDLKHKIIPDCLNITIAAIGIMLVLNDYSILSDRLLGALIGFVLFFIIALTTDAMGGGDTKLIAGLGLIFGLKGVLFIVFYSFVIGAVISVVLLFAKIKSRKDEIPFGPFISVATLLYIFYGVEIINLYLLAVI